MNYEYSNYGLIYIFDKEYFYQIVDNTNVLCKRDDVPLGIRVMLVSQIYSIPKAA